MLPPEGLGAYDSVRETAMKDSLSLALAMVFNIGVP